MRIWGIVLNALCVMVLGATAAHALVGVEFVPASAPPGARVQMTVVGLTAEDDVTFFLAPSQRVADAVTGSDPPRDPRVVPLRGVRIDDGNDLVAEFKVPPVEQGSYVLVVHCKDCGGAASTFSAVGDLEVVPASALPRTGREHGLLLGVGAALLALGAMLLLRPRELLRG